MGAADYYSYQQQIQQMQGCLGSRGGILGQKALGSYSDQIINVPSMGYCLTCGKTGCMEAHTIPATTKKEEYKMFKSIRAYYEKYQDVILTVAAIFLLDHYMFDGKFKTKLEQIMESLINKATSKIHAIEGAEGK